GGDGKDLAQAEEVRHRIRARPEADQPAPRSNDALAHHRLARLALTLRIRLSPSSSGDAHFGPATDQARSHQLRRSWPHARRRRTLYCLRWPTMLGFSASMAAPGSSISAR